MQRTEKYFEQDAFRTECESVILAAEPDENTGGGRIALDGTVFYPEGGGQPADRGTVTPVSYTHLAKLERSPQQARMEAVSRDALVQAALQEITQNLSLIHISQISSLGLALISPRPIPVFMKAIPLRRIPNLHN